MSDYYDPHPRLKLATSIVLAGQIGCGAAAIARHVASRTGLPFAEVDRLIEHETGRSLARLAFEEGPEAITERATRTLERELPRSPHGLLVLDRAWPDDSAVALLRDRARLVHVRRSGDYLLSRWPSALQRSGDWILGRGRASPPEDLASLAPLLARRAPLLDAAPIVVEGGEVHAHRVAELLLDSIERISDAEPV